MKLSEFQLCILDYLENTLAPEKRAEFDALLAASEEARCALSEYQALVSVEKTLCDHEPPPLSPNFSTRIMEEIEESQQLSALSRFLIGLYSSRLTAPCYTAVVVTLLFVIGNGLQPHFTGASVGGEVALVEVITPIRLVAPGETLELRDIKLGRVSTSHLPPGSVLSSELQHIIGRPILAPLHPGAPVVRSAMDWSNRVSAAQDGSDIYAVTVNREQNTLPTALLTPGAFVEVQCQEGKKYSQVLFISTFPAPYPVTTVQLRMPPCTNPVLVPAPALPLTYLSPAQRVDRYLASSVQPVGNRQEEGESTHRPYSSAKEPMSTNPRQRSRRHSDQSNSNPTNGDPRFSDPRERADGVGL